MDGLPRKIVSIIYNLFVWILWPRLGSLDVNGNPKILPSSVVTAMQLKSNGWFLDPEMIKAHYMGSGSGIQRLAFARIRSGSVSHVRSGNMLEFFRTLMYFRFSSELSRWKAQLQASPEWSRGTKSPTPLQAR